MADLSTAYTQGAQVGIEAARDPLSLKVADMMNTMIGEKGSMDRTKIAAGYRPDKATGELKEPSIADAMKQYAEMSNQMAPDEEFTIQGPGFVLKRKGKKEYTDYELRKEALRQAVSAWGDTFGRVPKPDGSGYYKNYQDLANDLYNVLQQTDIKQSLDYDKQKKDMLSEEAPAAGSGKKGGGFLNSVMNFMTANSAAQDARAAGTGIPTPSLAPAPTGPARSFRDTFSSGNAAARSGYPVGQIRQPVTPAAAPSREAKAAELLQSRGYAPTPENIKRFLDQNPNF